MIANLTAGVQAFTSNVFLIDGDRTVLIDVGANFEVVDRVRDRVDDVDAVVLTHTHHDHVGNLEAVTDAFDVDVWGYDVSVEGVDHALEDDAVVLLGDHEYRVVHTPGHKDDHCCFYANEPEICFGGDLVFQNGSFGRTDLPEGDRETLIASIDRLLEILDPSLAELHVGHGPSITNEPYGHIELAAQMARQH